MTAPSQRTLSLSYGAPAPAASKQPGCLWGLVLELSGIAFLRDLRRRWGTPLFSLSLSAVLGFTFLLGARIERYAHIGEHQYVLALLPTASCFSPLLALLMAWSFAVGDSLTNATYWLFPNHPVLNLYTFFRQPHPLLTWGAYLRMGFITLPLYAVLPGFGSRVTYAIAARAFAAGRARIVKDGGDPPKDLRRQLDAAAAERNDVAARQADAVRRLAGKDAEVAESAVRSRALDAEAQASGTQLAAANDETRRANDALRGAREQQTRAAAEAEGSSQQLAARTAERQAAEGAQEATDARLRLASGDEADARDRVDSLAREADVLGRRAGEEREIVSGLAARQQQLAETIGHGVGPDGRPLDARQLADLRRQSEIADAELRAGQARLAASEERRARIGAEQERAAAELRRRQAESERLLEQFRAERGRAERAAQAERAAERRAKEVQEAAERRADALRAAEAAARESQAKAEAQAQRLAETNRARERALAVARSAVNARNAVASELQGLATTRAGLDQKVASLASALGVAPPPPARGLAPPLAAATPLPGAVAAVAVQAGRRSRRGEDANARAIREWDQRMYAEMEQARREREAWLRDLQTRYAGSLPSGLGGGAVAGIGGAGATAGLGGLAASAVGALAGAAVGGGLLRGHMWAEYNPLRELLHPSHTRDVSCYKMDVRYLDQNILSGVGTSAAAAPVAVVTADTGRGPSGSAPLGPAPPTPPPADATDRAKAARDEAERVRKQWEESEQSADKNDPGYGRLKEQYDDYIGAKEREAEAAEDEAGRLRAEQQAALEAERQAEEQRGEWARNRQEDLKALTEEKAHLEAVMAGAAGAGFDVATHKLRLEQINGRLGELHRGLQKEGADISYTARDRGVIAPGQEFVEGPKAAAERKAELEQMQKWRRVAFDHGMLEPGAGGQRGDVYGRLGQIIKELSEGGKRPDPEELRKIRQHMSHRLEGRSADPSQTPPAEKEWWRDAASWRDALEETGRNISKGETSSGETHWVGMGGRMLIGALTGGSSELVLIPTSSMYTMKDAIDRGESGLSAFTRGVAEAGMEWVGEKVMEGGLKIAAGGIKGGYFKGWGGVLEGAGEAAEQAGKEIAEEGSNLVNPAAWGKRTVAVGGGGGSGEPPKGGGGGTGGEPPKRGGAGGDGPGGRGGGGGPEGPEAPRGGAGPEPERPRLTPEQRVTKERIEAAVASGDPAKIAELYQNGGMKKLAACQRAGGVSDEVATEVNRVIGEQVNDAVRRGTRDSIDEFQQATQVRLREVLVGDSGSSSRGPIARLKTDADRTLVPVFDDATLRQYANRNNISVGEAYDDLSRRFRDVHQENVDRQLIQRDLMPQDVGYNSYDRIGAGEQADVYGSGYTSARQATQGTTDVYRLSPDGNQIHEPRRSSGQALVDQNQINNANYDPCNFDGDATRIPPREVPGIVEQQVRAVEGRSDPECVAKALSRTDKAAAINGHALPNQKAVEMAEYIRNNPGWNQPEVERRFGMKLGDFVEQGKQQIFEYDRRIN